jgi:selenide,water dikinase
MSLGMLAFGEGAGCACKAEWGVVETLRRTVSVPQDAQLGLLDAGWLSPHLGVPAVGSVDFIGPVSRLPADFGAIAAAHAMSDLFAVGAAPQCGFIVVAWPRAGDLLRSLTQAIEAMCATAQVAGCTIVGGHTAYSEQPLLGMCVLGERSNCPHAANMEDGDLVYLSKPLGSGVVIGALREGIAAAASEQESTIIMKELNTAGIDLNRNPHVKIVTDVTGFGLAGQLLHVSEASGMGVTIDGARMPVITGVKQLIRNGSGTQAAERNWGELKDHIDCEEWESIVVACDPQTNGPLLFVASAEFAGSAFSSARKPFYEIGALTRRTGTQREIRIQ